MGVFSDFPYFILKNYYNTIGGTYSGTMGSYLRGAMTTIVIQYHWTHLYVENPDGDLVEHLFNITEVEGDSFKFTYGGAVTTFQDTSFESGAAVYFKKDSMLHEFLNKDVNSDGYEKFVNLNKTFVFFGNINIASNDVYVIEFDGLKNFTLNALPINNRTTNMQEFLNVCFDRVYHEIYGAQKNIYSMIDPKEVNLDFLNYIAEAYGIYIDNNSIADMGEIPIREWVDTIPYFLKRKGTYSAVYIIWKLFLSNTLNTLRIYEMWHDSSLTGSPYGLFYEVPYEEYYNVTPTGCVDPTGDGYYEPIAPSGYPYWPGTGDPYTTMSGVPSGMILSPHYKVEIDLSCEPLGSDYIINEDLLDNLLEGWEYTKPVCKFAHHQLLISPKTDFSEKYISLYGNDYTAHMSTIFTGSAFVFGGTGDIGLIPGAVKQSVAKSDWNIPHYLEDDEVLVQCYDENYKMIIPKTINIYSTDLVKVSFDTSVRGYCFVTSLGTSGTVYTQATEEYIWYVDHNLENQYVISQFFDDNKEMMLPDENELTDNNNTTVIWGIPEGMAGTYTPSSGSDDGYSDAVGFDNTSDFVVIDIE